MARPGGGILFPQRFHAGLVDGSVTRTIRAWKTLQVKVGGQYRMNAHGVLEVTAAEAITTADIDDDDAARAGFDGRDAVLAELQRVLKEAPAPDRVLYRVDLKWVALPDPRLALALEEPDDAEAAALADKLDALDARSRKGPWTWATLGLIGAFPEVSARYLAPKLGRERLPFKTDVRKLKGMGLTYSRETGYEVTPRGRALLAWEGRRRRS